MSPSRSWWFSLVLAAGVVGCQHDTDRGTIAPNAYVEPHTQPFPSEPQAEGAPVDNDDQGNAAGAVGSASERGSGSATGQGSRAPITSQREAPGGSGSDASKVDRDRDPDNDMNDLD